VGALLRSNPLIHGGSIPNSRQRAAIVDRMHNN